MSNPLAPSRCTWRPRWRHAILALASIAWLVIGRVDLATAQPRTLAPIYWQQRLFFIPYQINRHDKSLRAVAKVQLLISRDGMSDWRVLEQAEPNVQGFSYHAPEDGEYWFALRHLDQHGQPWPRDLSVLNSKSRQNTRDLSVLNSKSRQNTHGNVQPQLRIMVDTQLPELELSGALNATGAVVVRYEARDASLRPETLVIEVRPAGGTWSPLNPGPPDVSHADRLVGRVEWNAPFGASRVEVRGSIADGAGHRAQAGAEVALSGPSLRMPAAAIALAPARGEEASRLSPHTLSVDSSRSTTSAPAQDWPANNRLPRKSTASSDAVNLFAGSRPRALPPIRNPYSTSAPAGSSRRTPARLIGEGSSTYQPVPASGKSLYGGSPVLPNDWSPPAMTPTQSGARVVNSRTFDVQYDLESIGPWGVAKVELWGTHDGGRTWQSFGVDNDNRSPVRVTVPTAGVYGFRILVDGANGAAASPPRSGDKPELLVAVDLKPPTAELLSTDIGEGNLTGHLVIRWAVADTNLEPRPISLFYGTLPNGPWSTIAAGLENTGGYTWRLERHVPDRFYLRLEARDVAGNLATCQTPTPIMLNRPQPTGRLRGVRPVPADPRPFDTAENGR